MSNERIIYVKEKMAEGGSIEEVVKTELGEDTFMGDRNDLPFVMLLRVTQMNGKPLPTGGLTEQVMSQMLCEVARVIPKEAVVMKDQEVIMEFEEKTSIIEVPKAIHGLFDWGRQCISVDSLVAKRDLIADTVRECEVGWERQCDIE